jgi:hypothetical protein
MTNTRLTIRPPADFDLARDVCSYGYFLLAPNHWDPETRSLFRVLTLDDDQGKPAPTTCRITQKQPTNPSERRPERKRGLSESPAHPEPSLALGPSSGDSASTLTARFDRPLTRAEQAQARAQIARMLSLDTTEADDPRLPQDRPALEEIRPGPPLPQPHALRGHHQNRHESCNVAWPSTITMNARLCDVLGRSHPLGTATPSPPPPSSRAPAPRRPSAADAGSATATSASSTSPSCSTQPARSTKPGSPTPTPPTTTPSRSCSPSRASAPTPPATSCSCWADTAASPSTPSPSATARPSSATPAPTARSSRSSRPTTSRSAPQVPSYWFELWDFYESKRGPAHLWDRETTGKTFTAALLLKD